MSGLTRGICRFTRPGRLLTAAAVSAGALIAGATTAGATTAGATTAGAAAATASAAPAQPPKRAKSHALPHPLAITPLRASSIPTPRSFFGLSTEYWALPIYLAHRRLFERALSLLTVRNNGPMVLRIGGDSADVTYWNPGSYRLPPNADVLTEQWFTHTAQLAQDLHLNEIFDLNLHHSTPQLSAGLAAEAFARMPAKSILGFEIGNEPNRYGRGYRSADYVRDFRSYAGALAAAVPGARTFGPATGMPGGGGWGSAVVQQDGDVLGVLSGHRYPLSACSQPDAPEYPTVEKLLGDAVQQLLMGPVNSAVSLAHQSGRRFRLDELNSVTCGGTRGVSDTFATALWAPDALFRLLRARVDGVNVHIRPDTVNPPFFVTQAGLTVRPLLYGLILFRRVLDSGGRLIRLHLNGPKPQGLSIWGVRVRRNRLRLLLINKSSKSRTLVLGVRGKGSATVLRLRARSPGATSGVTLGGQSLDARGHWVGKEVVGKIPPGRSGYRLSAPPLSAGLINVELR